jgi:hypothetical protein
MRDGFTVRFPREYPNDVLMACIVFANIFYLADIREIIL